MPALETTGLFYTGPDRTGRSTLYGICQGDRYNHGNGAALQSTGFYGAIQSGLLYRSPNVDASLIIFWDDHFNGGFLQLTAPRGSGETDFWVSGAVHSWMLAVSAPGGVGEVRLSFRDIFFQEWITTIDDLIRGDGRRDVNPILTWDMFQDDPKYTGLHPNLPYLKVHQDLMVFVPWPYTDYHVWLEYWIYLYPSGTGVRAAVPQYWWWVEGGAITGKVSDRFAPKVAAGAGVLQEKLNNKLKRYDDLAPHGVRDVYYLPGHQTTPPGADVHGATTDDVTIVVAT